MTDSAPEPVAAAPTTTPAEAAAPPVPDGWFVFARHYGDDLAWGARKFFDGHWKEAVVDRATGDLFGACAKIDQEVGLRSQAADDAWSKIADDLEAEAARLRALVAGDTPAEPVAAAPAPEPDPEADPAPPVTVPSDGEVHADATPEELAAAQGVAPPETDPDVIAAPEPDPALTVPDEPVAVEPEASADTAAS